MSFYIHIPIRVLLSMYSYIYPHDHIFKSKSSVHILNYVFLVMSSSIFSCPYSLMYVLSMPFYVCPVHVLMTMFSYPCPFHVLCFPCPCPPVHVLLYMSCQYPKSNHIVDILYSLPYSFLA